VTVTLIYIAGYGRSGSTLLDILLGSGPGCFGAGEFSSLFTLLHNRNEALCACGEVLRSCEVWSAVNDTLIYKFGNIDYGKAEALTRVVESFGIPTSRRRRKLYRVLWSNAFEAVAGAVGSRRIVDSSKSSRYCFARPGLLASLPSINIKLVHLVRHPSGSVSSEVKGSNKLLASTSRNSEGGKPGSPVRALMGWTFANGVAELAQGRCGATHSYMLVNYESLVTNPVLTLGSVGSALQIPVSEPVQRLNQGAAFAAGHGLGGNRFRREGPVTLRPVTDIPPPSNRQEKIVRGIGEKIAVRYGYGT
jgi:hypothetical protein